MLSSAPHSPAPSPIRSRTGWDFLPLVTVLRCNGAELQQVWGQRLHAGIFRGLCADSVLRGQCAASLGSVHGVCVRSQCTGAGGGGGIVGSDRCSRCPRPPYPRPHSATTGRGPLVSPRGAPRRAAPSGRARSPPPPRGRPLRIWAGAPAPPPPSGRFQPRRAPSVRPSRPVPSRRRRMGPPGPA